MKDKVKNPVEVLGNQSKLSNHGQSYKVEFHSRHHKLVVRDLKTGKYTKKPNKH